MQHVQQRTATVVAQAIQDQLHPLQQAVRTLTADNGKEFAEHQSIATA
jgi:IS30 family transposase